MSLFSKLVARRLAAKAATDAVSPERRPETAATAAKDPQRFAALEKEVKEHLLGARHPRALAAVDAAISSRPDTPSLRFLRATVLQEWGRAIEARAAFLAVVAPDEADPESRRRMTVALLQTGDLADAERWARGSVALHPDQATHFLLGAILHSSGKSAEAIEQLERVLALNPDNFDAIGLLGWCKYEIEEFDAADQLLERAIATDARRPGLWTTLGTSKYRQGNLDEAIRCFEAAVQLEFAGAESAGGAANLALALLDESRFEEIFTLCARALPIHPSVQLHLALALALLTARKYSEGWPLFEARFFKEPLLSQRRAYPRPLWRGQNLSGKTILLAQEQGVGDLIQCMRYAVQLKAAGARVMLATAPGLEAFCSGFEGVDQVVGPGPVPLFDYYCHVMSLPGLFQEQGAETPGSMRYLHVDDSKLAAWKTLVPPGDELKVGLVWAGNPEHGKDRERSLALSELESLWEAEGARFYSLQKGIAAADAAKVDAGQPMMDLSGKLDDYGDTAAAISCLDLVISVDTSVAHLAGALGKPVWTLLPVAADWRWGRTGDVTPWYPSMRLFRQTKHLQWKDTIIAVREELRRAVSDRGHLASAADPMPRPAAPRVADYPVAARPWRVGASCFTQARHGLFQFLPGEDDESDAIGVYGDYLDQELSRLSDRVRPGQNIVEIRSGIGSHAIPLAREIGAQGHLIAIEDRPRIREALRQNLDANRIANVTVLSLERRVAATPPLGPESPIAPPDPESPISIDELGLASLQLLKINVGQDAAVALAGAVQTIWKLRPAVWVFASTAAEVAAAGEALFDMSYRCWRREVSVFDEHNFNEWAHDLFDRRRAHILLAMPEEAGTNVAPEKWTALS